MTLPVMKNQDTQKHQRILYKSQHTMPANSLRKKEVSDSQSMTKPPWSVPRTTHICNNPTLAGAKSQCARRTQNLSTKQDQRYRRKKRVTKQSNHPSLKQTKVPLWHFFLSLPLSLPRSRKQERERKRPRTRYFHY
jgi:hypothetical protein